MDKGRAALKAQLGFVKDSLYGTLCVLLFSSFRWQQWQLSAAHVLSVPCVFLVGAAVPEDAGRRTVQYVVATCVVATMVVILTDVVLALTLSCSLKQCCEPGKSSPAFAPSMDVCTASRRLESRVVSLVAMVTVGVGALQSCVRLVSLGGLAGSEGTKYGLPVAYLALRFYQFSWMAGVDLGSVAALWAVAAVCVLVRVAFLARSSAPSPKARKVLRLLPLAVAALDVGALLLAATGVVPASVQVAAVLVQLMSAFLSVWMFWSTMRTKNAPKPVEEITSAGAGLTLRGWNL